LTDEVLFMNCTFQCTFEKINEGGKSAGVQKGRAEPQRAPANVFSGWNGDIRKYFTICKFEVQELMDADKFAANFPEAISKPKA